jgi:hypothetical protein
MGGILSNVLTIAGRVRGAWSRVRTPGVVRLDVRLLAPLGRPEAAAAQRAAARLGRFLATPVELRWRN